MKPAFTIPVFSPPQRSARLEQTKLSRILPARLPGAEVAEVFRLTNQLLKEVPACVNCNRKLSKDREFLQRVGVCATCLRIYARIDSALNGAADKHTQAAKLQKFMGGVR